ncbi:phenylalanyl-trna synthetase b3/b4 [Lucifera butyrica]|uniref:Phenylalanyl-trna synthetase b3/b4 n=1 Tax=Lucifera butyrica TaxID=1351585 RepID=A0A498RCD6_9FIRM|nr:phenylalanine--tRNA ligase beta subunit-related protein [Lucifera butyrica]VBB08675.1 phenylalanyl-trna synthetase b3/b4 [Lucifera butyrica]
MNITIHESIKDSIPCCRLGCTLIQDVIVRGTPPPLTREFMDLQAEMAQIYNLKVLPTIPRIASVRNMYKKLDVDPSRYRPASEALVRRVLQGKGLYYVNSAVDVNNYCSIKFLLPFGIYDAGQIAGDVTYCLAENGTYINIAGKQVSTDQKPFLTDSLGFFGNPTSDSRRTAVTLSTRNLLSVIFADEEIGEPGLNNIMEFFGDMIVKYNGGRIVEKKVVHA